MLLSEVTITIADIRKVGYCVAGVRRWFPQQRLDFTHFLQNGISAEDLLATNDELAQRVVDAKIEREGLTIDGYTQETFITVFREDGTEMFVVRGLFEETSYTIPMSYVEEETRVFIRLHAVLKGVASIQAFGLYIDLPTVGAPDAPPASPIVVGTVPPPPDEPDEPTPVDPGAGGDPPTVPPGGGGNWTGEPPPPIP